MRFSISSAELKEQLQIISGAIGNNPVLPILEDFLFKVEGNTLSIVGTDLETFMTAELAVQASEGGNIAIPAKILVDTLKQLPTQPITIIVDKETYAVVLQTSSGKYELAGENGDDYPRLPSADTTSQVELPAALLLQGVNKTLFATSSDELRPAMTGVFVKIEPEGITFVATDAHKLVKYNFTDIQSGINASFIIPKKALNLLTKALTNASMSVQISFSRTNAFFYFGNQQLACRLIDANFPDYNAVIPTKNPNKMLIMRAEFLAALKRIANYANKTTNQVKLNLAEGSLTIEAEDLDFAQKGTEQLACQYEGTELTIGFNAKFLIEMLNTLNSDNVQFELSSPNRAGILRPDENDVNEDLLMLVMPVMLYS
jgi:DNA polymerase-3 subunit beta